MRVVLEFRPIDLLSLRVSLLLQECRAQPVPGGERKRLRLVVSQGVFELHRLLKCRDRRVEIVPFAMQRALEDTGRHAEQILGRVEPHLCFRGLRGVLDAVQIDLGEIGIAFTQMCVALGEVPEPPLDLALRSLRHLEHFIEPTESQQGQRVMDTVPRQLVVVLAGLDGHRALAVHRRREQQHVQVVLGVDGDAGAECVPLVGMPGSSIRFHAIGPTPDLIPRVRRHVVDVTGSRNRTPEMFRARLGLVRPCGGLSRVNIEMARAGVLDVSREDAFERRVQSLYSWVVDVPRAPSRLEQEQGVSIHGGGIEIIRECLDEQPHRFRVGLVLIPALVDLEVLHVADRERIDIRPLARVGVHFGQSHRLPDRRVGMRGFRWSHRSVQV